MSLLNKYAPLSDYLHGNKEVFIKQICEVFNAAVVRPFIYIQGTKNIRHIPN